MSDEPLVPEWDPGINVIRLDGNFFNPVYAEDEPGGAWCLSSPDELPDRLASFAAHLRRHREVLLNSGFCREPSRALAWLDQIHNRLYPPWEVGDPPVERQTPQAQPLPCLDTERHLSEPARVLLCGCRKHRHKLRAQRSLLLGIKLDLLDTLATLRPPTPEGHVWSSSLAIVTESLTQADLVFFLDLDSLLRSKTSPVISPVKKTHDGETDTPPNLAEPQKLQEEPYQPVALRGHGGLLELLALVGHCEMELERGLWSGFVTAFSRQPWSEYNCFSVDMVEFWRMFQERLQKSIVTDFRAPLTIALKPKHLHALTAPLRTMANFLEASREAGVSVVMAPPLAQMPGCVAESPPALLPGVSSWARSDGPPSSVRAPEPVPQVEPGRYRFKSVGKHWILAFDTDNFPLPDNKGFHYLRILLTEPERLFDVATLWPAVNRTENASRRRLQPGPPKVTREDLVDKQQLLDIVDEAILKERETLDDVEGAVVRIHELERTRADLVRDAQAVARYGNTLVSKHKNLKNATIRRDDERGLTSEAINAAITRAIDVIGEEPSLQPLAEHLRLHCHYARNKFYYNGSIKWDTRVDPRRQVAPSAQPG